MDSRVRILNKHLKAYDRDLYSIRTDSGMLQLWKTNTYWESFEFNEKKYLYAKSTPVFILALTDNWLLSGNPVEWGIEPLMRRVREMDQWRDDSMYENLVKEREQKESNKRRAFRNNVKALAYDLRRDFAKATNDINTSSLEKTDNRRKKDGYCK